MEEENLIYKIQESFTDEERNFYILALEEALWDIKEWRAEICFDLRRDKYFHDLANLALSKIYKYENNKTSANLKTLIKYAKECGRYVYYYCRFESYQSHLLPINPNYYFENFLKTPLRLTA